MDITEADEPHAAVVAAALSRRNFKQQIYGHGGRDPAPALAESDELMARSLREPGFRDGVTGVVERGAPRFETRRTRQA